MQKVNLSISDIQHIGIPVTNFKTSETFYSNLGFENVMQANFIHDNEQGTCIMMKQGNIVIELYEMPQKELAAVAARKDGHVDHVAFDVADIDATFSLLKNAGYNIAEAAPVFYNSGKMAVSILISLARIVKGWNLTRYCRGFMHNFLPSIH